MIEHYLVRIVIKKWENLFKWEKLFKYQKNRLIFLILRIFSIFIFLNKNSMSFFLKKVFFVSIVFKMIFLF